MTTNTWPASFGAVSVAGSFDARAPSKAAVSRTYRQAVAAPVPGPAARLANVSPLRRWSAQAGDRPKIRMKGLRPPPHGSSPGWIAEVLNGYPQPCPRVPVGSSRVRDIECPRAHPRCRRKHGISGAGKIVTDRPDLSDVLCFSRRHAAK